MKTLADLPEDARIVVLDQRDLIEVFIGDRKGDRRTVPPMGTVTMHRPIGKPYYFVGLSQAPDWGALLYRAAIVVATERSQGLVPDRGVVSLDARALWDRMSFYSDEIDKGPLTADERLHGDEELDTVYSASAQLVEQFRGRLELIRSDNMAAVPQLRLRSGLRLADPQAMLHAKFEQWPWDKYDGDAPANPDRVTVSDVERANRLGARLSNAVWERLIQRKGDEINALLAQLPKVALEDVELETIRAPLITLLDLMIDKHVSISRATKVLYPFRPKLLAVLDSVVEYYYWYATSVTDEACFRRLQSSTWGEYAFELLQLIRADVVAAKSTLDAIRVSFSGQPYAEVSRVRMLESLIWWYYAREGTALPPSAGE